MLVLMASLFFTNPMPLDMPRAEAYQVSERGGYRLEDRYNRIDLWTSRTVLGCWQDDAGRNFTVAALEVVSPEIDDNSVESRLDYTKNCVAMKKKDKRRIRDAISRLAPPIELSEKGVPPRQMCRGYKDIDYWQGTNTSAIVCTFLPEQSEIWYLAVWELVEGDVLEENLKQFEREFLEKEWKEKALSRWVAPKVVSERELLRADAHHSITNYSAWHWTDSEEFTILDDLPGTSGIVISLTNELPVLRAKYAATVPTPVNGSNVLCVARIYGSRAEYLAATDEDMSWTAAYWSPLRRELVAHLPKGGESVLMKTFRHEAFHQYLSYACSMIPVSPWFNEGYAQYFEDEDCMKWGMQFDLDNLAQLVPSLLVMDYDEFYSGSDLERRIKYKVAWSIVVFIEKGAPNVRNKPFAKLKDDYIGRLMSSRNMKDASNAAFRNAEHLAHFVSEWKRFWENTLVD